MNESGYKFAVNEKGQIRFGLGAIKGIGEGPSETIVEARKNGKFKNVFDFFERVSGFQINKRVVESLVMAGAFDELDNYSRAQYFAKDAAGKTTNIERLLKYGQDFNGSKNSVENSLFADFAEEVKIEYPKMMQGEEWSNMSRLNKEKEVVGFYISAHPMDDFKFQYQFLQGKLSRSAVLEKQKQEISAENSSKIESDEEMPDVEMMEDFEGEENGEIQEEITKTAEPKGSFNFLNLDEVEAYKEIAVKKHQPSKEKFDYRNRNSQNAQGQEFTVAGLITDYTIRDGYNSGEKVAFLTLEDYTGSCSFRLGDKDYMKLREKLALHRFVILKIRYAVLSDGRCFVNVNEVIELSEAFEKYAKNFSIIVNIIHLKENDIEFFYHLLSQNSGKVKVNFYLKNETDQTHLDLPARFGEVALSNELFNYLIKEKPEYEFFLN